MFITLFIRSGSTQQTQHKRSQPKVNKRYYLILATESSGIGDTVWTDGSFELEDPPPKGIHIIHLLAK